MTSQNSEATTSVDKILAEGKRVNAALKNARNILAGAALQYVPGLNPAFDVQSEIDAEIENLFNIWYQRAVAAYPGAFDGRDFEKSDFREEE